MEQVEWREALEIRELDNVPSYNGEYLEGYAIVYNDVSNLVRDNGTGEAFREIIAPGAFTQSIKTSNISFAFLHSDNAEYGDTNSKTLILAEDSNGIYFRMSLPPYANTLKNKISSGAIKGMSFGFLPRDVEVRKDGVRIVKRGELKHISPVYNPAYNKTEVKIKSSNNDLMNMKLKLKGKIL